MDSKKIIKKEVELVLEMIHQKIDSIKEQVEKLCETTDCFKYLSQTDIKKDKKE